MFLHYLSFLLTFCLVAYANVEKTIFLAPHTLTVPTVDPTLDDLGLERLSPTNPVLRTKLNASFPTTESQGTESWYFLEHLTPGRRYEVRICWLATQPTAFSLDTHTVTQAVETPDIFSSITFYSQARLASPSNVVPRQPSTIHDQAPTSDSVLFLRVTAAADYFSLDQSLMENVPPVVADIILDPFLFNVFPQSLIPTACYISLVACLAVFIGRWVLGQFDKAIDSTIGQKDKKQ
ncbi:hypothetical protein BDV25DRAFT_67961 [Aspergillus avenaceus]|uniref:Uncharacterized protein n=1 Tax=Aspergillus avenaceus TaxID=36643 RepID=A0A5N6U1J1_ASPAV|nr:hypothetical protein BDV25DRAFT_67961 [Aspergillus avenaceus]